MKKLTAVSMAAACGFFAGGALAEPISLPFGPIFVQFQNFEQINPAADPGEENAWGIARINQMSTGTILIPNSEITGNVEFFDGTSATGPQVTAMFYGLEATECTSTLLCSTSGFMDLYWDEAGLVGGGTIVSWDSATLTPALRTGTDSYTGVTDGIFLARLEFASGADAADSDITLTGDIIPQQTGFSGVANGFFNVDVDAGGVWAGSLDGDWFDTVFGTRDLKFKNSYVGPLGAWTDQVSLGAVSTDPVQAFAVPEPGSLGLLGLGLLGLSLVFRRRRSG